MSEWNMTSAEVVYFDRPGKHNTDEVLDLVSKALKRTGIDTVVIASNSGETATKGLARLSDLCKNIIVVTSHAGFSGMDELDMDPDVEDQLRQSGAKLVRASHILSGVERSFTRRFQGISRAEVVSETLRALFGQGMKVCVEISVMAADSGYIARSDDEIVAVGGTGEGADTACIVRPAHANNFFKLEVREVIAIPRSRTKGE